MAITELSRFTFGDMTAVYLIDGDASQVGFHLVPTEALRSLAGRRETLKGQMDVDLLPPQMGYPLAWRIDPLVQLSVRDGGGPGGFARGKTMRGGPSQDRLVFESQEERSSAGTHQIETRLSSSDGLAVSHVLTWNDGDPFVSVTQTLSNAGDSAVTIDMVSSFTLSHISPFADADAPRRLRVHRFRSDWSAEGRHVTQSAEELGLERSWSGHGARCERFGQVGTMPVRGWFPTVFVEDTEVGVFWGASLSWAGSWQIELYRKDDCLNVSGGLADRELGHWSVTLEPGDSLRPPEAVLTTCVGTVDSVGQRLTRSHRTACLAHPEPEDELPIVFNEWCTSWGNPTHENLIQCADALSGEGIRYLVIDAGWYKPPTGNWSSAQGDWRASSRSFPDGLAATCRRIREAGLVPGLWFEYECIGPSSDAWSDDVGLQLTLGGLPIDSGGRRFWDMRKEETHRLLESRVIDTLERNEIGYIKIDYNETAGFGADDGDSHGEAIRRHVLGVYRFLERLRERLPDLVIENCSSGGHRLEPSMLGRSAMSSFSDAHECLEIPIIAANLHRLILPRQSQIWAVLHATDSPKRMIYSLAAGFLGRLCLSGEITSLTAGQWHILRSALALYREADSVIADGESRRYGTAIDSFRYPRGRQAVVRSAERADLWLVVVHRFEDGAGPIAIPIHTGRERGGPTKIVGSLVEPSVVTTLSDNEGETTLRVERLQAFSAAVVVLSR